MTLQKRKHFLLWTIVSAITVIRASDPTNNSHNDPNQASKRPPTSLRSRFAPELNQMSKITEKVYRVMENMELPTMDVETFNYKVRTVNGTLGAPRTLYYSEKGHAVRLDFGALKFRLGRSEDEPEHFELAMFVPSMGRQIRDQNDKKMTLMMLPMMFGVKSFIAVMLLIVGVTVVTVKALFAAKIALIFAVLLGMKKFFDEKLKHGAFGTHGHYHDEVPFLTGGGYHPTILDWNSLHGGLVTAAGFDGLSSYGLQPDVAGSAINVQYEPASSVGTETVAQQVAQPNDLSLSSTASVARRRDTTRLRPVVYRVIKQRTVAEGRKMKGE